MEQATLIAGCGYVGTQLGLNLRASGGVPYGLRRRVGLLPSEIVPVVGDLAHLGSLPEVPALDAVVYCPSAGARTREAYARAYVEGVDNLRDALGARADRLSRSVFVSSTAVWGETTGDDVDERTAACPSGFTGELLLEGEARFQARFPNAVILRLSGIYGPGRTRMVAQVATGGPFDSSHATVGNRIHRDDAAGAIVHLLAHESPEPLYVGVDDDAVRLGDVRAFIAERVGVDATPFRSKGPSVGKRLRNHRLRGSGFDLAFTSYQVGYPAIIAAWIAAGRP